ncbi:MAG: DUF2752 domain-containing protein [Desulfobacteraceae bacterium]|nr:DUF2752 domain-containing protein [Desulfobacteraceae bacterium]
MKTGSDKKKQQFLVIRLALLSTVLAVSIVLPPDLFVERYGDAATGGICLFKRITSIPCPLCGMTRAFVYAGHLRIVESFFHNPAGFVLFLYMVIYISAGWSYLVFPMERLRSFLEYQMLIPMTLLISGSWVILLYIYRGS